MKNYLPFCFLFYTSSLWALSVNITSPLPGTVFPSTQNSVTISGSVSEAPGQTGSVVCSGNRTVTFSSQNPTTWLRGWPLTSGLNTVTCVYTKGSETASTTVSFTKQSSTPVNQAPNAVIGAAPSTGTAPHNVSFSSGSYDNDGSIVSYLWTYGDGATSTSSTSHQHIYTVAGVYTAKLKVTDNLGAWDEITKVITVTAPTNQNSTLLGIDADNDGIRDDVQAWIDTTYSNQPQVKLAAKQYAHAFQNAFANKDNKPNSIQASNLVLTAVDCLLRTLKDQGMTIEQSIHESDKLKLLHLNTKERILAQQKMNENFSGSSYTLKTKAEACNF